MYINEITSYEIGLSKNEKDTLYKSLEILQHIADNRCCSNICIQPIYDNEIPINLDELCEECISRVSALLKSAITY